jgi:hypothetical protein
MRKTVKKLSLSRETIRLIQDPARELGRVAGGFTDSCPDSWCTCTYTVEWSCWPTC